MSATVNDTVHWEASRSVVATITGDEFVMTGTEKSGHFVKITVRGVSAHPGNPDSTQTFSLSAVTSALIGFGQFGETGSDLFSTTVQGGSGNVTITHLTDERAQGTFQFSAVRSNPPTNCGSIGCQDLFRRVSGGHFDVRLR